MREREIKTEVGGGAAPSEVLRSPEFTSYPHGRSSQQQRCYYSSKVLLIRLSGGQKDSVDVNRW